MVTSFITSILCIGRLRSTTVVKTISAFLRPKATYIRKKERLRAEYYKINKFSTKFPTLTALWTAKTLPSSGLIIYV
jgi:hypothetical protein